ncbi:MAG: alpha/beta hydrolase [Pseudomonadota bacterium]
MAGDQRVEDYLHVLEQGEGESQQTLVLLHGTGGDEREMASLGHALADAALPGAAVLALRGDVLEHGMPRFFRRRAEGVYDMADLARATAKLGGFLPRVLERAGRDPAQAIGIGYSNGANILANLMFAQPRLLGGWALLHPLIPFEPAIEPAEGARVFVGAGLQDPICPPEATRALIGAIEAAGGAVETAWQPGGHQLARDELAALARWLIA